MHRPGTPISASKEIEPTKWTIFLVESRVFFFTKVAEKNLNLQPTIIGQGWGKEYEEIRKTMPNLLRK
jgi:hypothetical protein